MSEAPASMWVRPDFNICRSAPFADAVRYVRADLYEALEARVAVMWRCWGEAQLEPLNPVGEPCNPR